MSRSGVPFRYPQKPIRLTLKLTIATAAAHEWTPTGQNHGRPTSSAGLALRRASPAKSHQRIETQRRDRADAEVKCVSTCQSSAPHGNLAAPIDANFYNRTSANPRHQRRWRMSNPIVFERLPVVVDMRFASASRWWTRRDHAPFSNPPGATSYMTRRPHLKRSPEGSSRRSALHSLSALRLWLERFATANAAGSILLVILHVCRRVHVLSSAIAERSVGRRLVHHLARAWHNRKSTTTGSRSTRDAHRHRADERRMHSCDWKSSASIGRRPMHWLRKRCNAVTHYFWLLRTRGAGYLCDCAISLRARRSAIGAPCRRRYFCQRWGSIHVAAIVKLLSPSNEANSFCGIPGRTT